MSLSKWAAFAVLFGFIIILDPTHTPGQPPRMGGGGGPPRMDGGGGGPPRMDGGGGGKRGMMDPENMWAFYQKQTGSTGDTIDLGKLPDWAKKMNRDGASKFGIEPLPESGTMTKSEFIDRSTRATAKIQEVMKNGGPPTGPGPGPGPGGPPMGPGPGGPPRGPGGNNEDPEERAKGRIAQQDKNGDNKVSKEEADGMLRGNFDRFDTNKDGFIELSEYKEGIIAVTGGGNRDNRDNRDNKDNRDYNDPNRRDEKKEVEEPKPKALRYDTLPETLPEWYKPSDSDRDGQVALHEWRKAGKTLAEFNTYDLNGDGLLTADEFLRFNRQKEESERIAAIIEGTATGARAANPPRGGGGGSRGSNGSNGSSDKTSDKGSEKTSDSEPEKTTDKGSEKDKEKDKGGTKDNPFQTGGKVGGGPPRK